MAWVKYQDSDGLVLGVYATQAEAAPDAGQSREELDPLPDAVEPFAAYRASDGTYSNVPPESESGDPAKAAQRQDIHDALLYWRVHGRTEYWVSLSADTTDPRKAIRATDKWAHHIVALCDRVIEGEVFSAKTASERQAFVDHAANILRTLGPAWYAVQVAGLASGGAAGTRVENYAGSNTGTATGSVIYTDICTSAGATRDVDGSWIAIGTTIASSFDAESSTLGR